MFCVCWWGLRLSEGTLTLQVCCLVLSSMATLGASSQVGPMRRTTRKQMLFMQLWIKGWTREGKREGKTRYCPSPSLSAFEQQLCLGSFQTWRKASRIVHVSTQL